jgi:hypothetical protein
MARPGGRSRKPEETYVSCVNADGPGGRREVRWGLFRNRLDKKTASIVVEPVEWLNRGKRPGVRARRLIERHGT